MTEHGHISTEDLLGWILGDLDAAAATRVATRVSDSSELRDRADQLRDVVARLRDQDQVDAPELTIRRAIAIVRTRTPTIGEVIRQVARLVIDTRRPETALAFRSSGTDVQLGWEFENGRVEATLGPDLETPTRRWLVGQVTVNDRSPVGRLVFAGPAGEDRSAKIDEHGSFECTMPMEDVPIRLVLDDGLEIELPLGIG